MRSRRTNRMRLPNTASDDEARSPSSPFHHANGSKQITGYPNGYPVICMARWKGLEPPTFWFVAKHSIQLSYQRVSAR